MSDQSTNYKEQLKQCLKELRNHPPLPPEMVPMYAQQSQIALKILDQTPADWINCAPRQARRHLSHLTVPLPASVELYNSINFAIHWLRLINDPNQNCPKIVLDLERILSFYEYHPHCPKEIVTKTHNINREFLFCKKTKSYPPEDFRRIMRITDDLNDFLDERLPKGIIRPSKEVVMAHLDWLIQRLAQD